MAAEKVGKDEQLKHGKTGGAQFAATAADGRAYTLTLAAGAPSAANATCGPVLACAGGLALGVAVNGGFAFPDGSALAPPAYCAPRALALALAGGGGDVARFRLEGCAP